MQYLFNMIIKTLNNTWEVEQCVENVDSVFIELNELVWIKLPYFVAVEKKTKKQKKKKHETY